MKYDSVYAEPTMKKERGETQKLPHTFQKRSLREFLVYYIWVIKKMK